MLGVKGSYQLESGCSKLSPQDNNESRGEASKFIQQARPGGWEEIHHSRKRTCKIMSRLRGGKILACSRN